MPRVHPPGSAKDDLPHRRAEMVPKLAAARSCVPHIEDNPEDPGHDSLTIELDRLGNELVACAQLPTRRDVSVFFDRVSYACWNLDPATAHLTRRADLGRSYYRCQDGGCVPEDHQATSYDGSARVVVDDTSVTILARPGDKEIARFPTPTDLVGKAMFRDDLAYVGHLIYIHPLDDGPARFEVYDERGTQVATLPGGEMHVVDDDLVVVATDPLHATLFDPRTKKTRTFAAAGCTNDELHVSTDASPGCQAAVLATHLTDAIRFRSKLYAIDQFKPALVELDPATFRERKKLPLAVCPP